MRLNPTPTSPFLFLCALKAILHEWRKWSDSVLILLYITIHETISCNILPFHLVIYALVLLILQTKLQSCQAEELKLFRYALLLLGSFCYILKGKLQVVEGSVLFWDFQVRHLTFIQPITTIANKPMAELTHK